ncbi:unnamed protein product [Closterium sp. Yama58-4]|nr:unnamed protein product [Closterium sp. Yama58-4]
MDSTLPPVLPYLRSSAISYTTDYLYLLNPLVTMAASPAALLPFLVLAVICAVATAHVAAGERGADRRNTPRVRVDGASSAVTTRRSLKIKTRFTAYMAVEDGNADMPAGVGAGVGGDSTGMVAKAKVRVATQVNVVPAHRMINFNAPATCVALEPSAQASLNEASQGVEVWWLGAPQQSNGFNGKRQVACSKVSFFQNSACQGAPVAEAVKPQVPNLKKNFPRPRWVGDGHAPGWMMGMRLGG